MNNKIEISPHGSLLVYKQGYTPEFVFETIQKHHLHGLRIFSELKEDRILGLNFLKDYSFLEALDVTSTNDYEFDFLLSLEKLRYLSINVEGKNKIDLSGQTNVLELVIKWRKNIKGIDNCTNIQNLCLVEYNMEDLREIEALRNLRELKIKTSTIKTVNGLEDLNFLEKISIGNCKRLRKINKLSGKQSITSITLEQCSRIEDYEELTYLPSLKELSIIDCKNISSINFINKLPSLTKLQLLGNTNILDGDLMPARFVKEIFYKHRSHYNIILKNPEAELLRNKNMEKINKLKNR